MHGGKLWESGCFALDRVSAVRPGAWYFVASVDLGLTQICLPLLSSAELRGGGREERRECLEKFSQSWLRRRPQTCWDPGIFSVSPAVLCSWFLTDSMPAISFASLVLQHLLFSASD